MTWLVVDNVTGEILHESPDRTGATIWRFNRGLNNLKVSLVEI